jgi:hypothetical protein
MIQNYILITKLLYIFIYFYSERDASHPEIYLYYTLHVVPAAPPETVGEAGIESGIAALHSGDTQWTLGLYHEIWVPFFYFIGKV